MRHFNDTFPAAYLPTTLFSSLFFYFEWPLMVGSGSNVGDRMDSGVLVSCSMCSAWPTAWGGWFVSSCSLNVTGAVA